MKQDTPLAAISSLVSPRSLCTSYFAADRAWRARIPGGLVAFSVLLRQFVSLCLQHQPEVAIPAWAVSQCDGGRGAPGGCAQLLLPSAAERLYVFRARPQGIPESF